MPLMIKYVKSNGKSLHSDTSRLLKTNAPDVDDIAVGFRALKLNGYQNFPETKTQVCLLCEVILKQIPAFNFFCASFESITAIEITWKWVKGWEDTRELYLGLVGREKMALDKLAALAPQVILPPISNFSPCLVILVIQLEMFKCHVTLSSAIRRHNMEAGDADEPLEIKVLRKWIKSDMCCCMYNMAVIPSQISLALSDRLSLSSFFCDSTSLTIDPGNVSGVPYASHLLS
ncbi:hypothetical protein Tco_1359659 [Tanacetum coccineum]